MGLKLAELCQARFGYQRLITNEDRWGWLRWEVLAVFWGTSEQEFQEHWLFVLLWCKKSDDGLSLMSASDVFPTSPCTTLFWIATFEGQWLKRVQTPEPAVPQHLTLLPAAFYFEQGDRTYLELVLMLYYEMLKVEIIASWGICSGLLLGGSFMLWWKRVRTRKREKSQWDTWLVAVLVWNLLEQPPAGREESSWCHWATPGPVLPLETTQAFKCILLSFFFPLIITFQPSGWPA